MAFICFAKIALASTVVNAHQITHAGRGVKNNKDARITAFEKRSNLMPSNVANMMKMAYDRVNRHRSSTSPSLLTKVNSVGTTTTQCVCEGGNAVTDDDCSNYAALEGLFANYTNCAACNHNYMLMGKDLGSKFCAPVQTGLSCYDASTTASPTAVALVSTVVNAHQITHSGRGVKNKKEARITEFEKRTASPTANPTTGSPTFYPTTASPTANPTGSPTFYPTTASPTANPTTGSPTTQCACVGGNAVTDADCSNYAALDPLFAEYTNCATCDDNYMLMGKDGDSKFCAPLQSGYLCNALYCGLDQRVEGNACVSCSKTQTSTGGSVTACTDLQCFQNERVADDGHACQSCPETQTSAGGTVTACTDLQCPQHERVADGGHACQSCPEGYTSDGGTQTSCTALNCGTNEYVVGNVCSPCQAGYIGGGSATACTATDASTTAPSTAPDASTTAPSTAPDASTPAPTTAPSTAPDASTPAPTTAPSTAPDASAHAHQAGVGGGPPQSSGGPPQSSGNKK